jgi:hypothetical protein
MNAIRVPFASKIIGTPLVSAAGSASKNNGDRAEVL